MKVMECCTKKKATGLHSRGRYGGGFQVEVDVPAKPPDSQITMAWTLWRRCGCIPQAFEAFTCTVMFICSGTRTDISTTVQMKIWAI